MHAAGEGLPTTDIPNIWACRDGEVHRNPVRPLVPDLDVLPWPDTDDFNKHYIENGRVRVEEPWKRTAEYRIYLSRGCPYNCSYCYVSILRDLYGEQKTPFYRHRSVEHVLGELERVRETFPRWPGSRSTTTPPLPSPNPGSPNSARSTPAASGSPSSAC